MSGPRLRDCGAAEAWSLQEWLDRWLGTTRWPPPGLTPGPAARAGLLWEGTALQKVVVTPDGDDVALCTLHGIDLVHLHAELSWLADPEAPGVGQGIAAFVVLAFRSFPVRKLSFEVAVDGFDVRPDLALPVHHVGRRTGHLRRDATHFADVDIYEIRSDDVPGAASAWSERGG